MIKNKIKQFFKQLFCIEHKYINLGFYQKWDGSIIRYYKCDNCGKEIWIDKRYDKYDK